MRGSYTGELMGRTRTRDTAAPLGRTAREIERAIDRWVERHVSCATCQHVRYDLFGPYCVSPEDPLGYLGVDTSMCEMHDFKNAQRAADLEKRMDRWYKAWAQENPEYAET